MPPPSRKQRIARAKAILQATVLENPWIPHQIRDLLSVQQAELLVWEGREALYGGAAGGGKSVALLAGALQYVDVPGYHALILRRTFAMLEKPGALIHMSKDWLAGVRTPQGKADYNESKHRWTFPSGATLTFGHIQDPKNVFDYQGAAYSYVGYDELTQFTESMYIYLFSRTRRKAGDRVPVRMRAASNPGGEGHEWVKARFVRPKKPNPERIFVPAKLQDNRGIDQADYLASLAHLDPITLAQLLAGDWDAVPGGRFRREHLRYYRIVNVGFGQGGEYDLGDRRYMARDCWRFMTVDPAASDKTTADQTAISVWAVTPDYRLIWLDCFCFQLQIPDIVPQIQSVYSQWLPEYVAIEAVASNRAVLQEAMRTRMVVKEVGPRGEDKLVRATKAMVLSRSGRLYLPDQSHWKDDAQSELLRFTGAKDGQDDRVDTVSYAAACLEEHDAAGDGGKPMVLGSRGW